LSLDPTRSLALRAQSFKFMAIHHSAEAIAIIGMAGRFPGAANIDQFWENLASGRESIQLWPDEDLLALGVDATTLAQPDYVKASAILDDIDLFDAEFFRLNAREAEITDPQHRLFLECAWEVMEQSGHPPGKTAMDVGVFVAASRGGYEAVLQANPTKVGRLGLYRLSLATEREFIPAWVSYKLGLCGPSVAVQTACSSGLTVVHAACQSLQRGECAMALAGAVSIFVRQKEGYFFQPGGINSPDGHCRAFDKNSRGTVRGNGLGAVLLKPLADAQRDGDYIWAIIRGSASNNDGARRPGFTAPSPDGQADVIRRALEVAGVSADSISYVEAHGTATELGDPTEIEGLKLAFQHFTKRRGFCAVGSVKTNIGHLNSAAGMAGLIKTVLSLHHGKIPPSLNCEIPNPLIPFQETPFYVNTVLRDWPEEANPRRAGVSSFGVGGTNVHVVLEAAPRKEPTARSGRCQLLSISANSEAALRDAAANLTRHLVTHNDLELTDVAYTLHTGRSHRSHRQMLVCTTTAEAVEALRSKGDAIIAGQAPREPVPVGMLFPGHGCEHVGMGRELYESEPIFRDIFDECSTLLRDSTPVDLHKLCYTESGQEEISQQHLKFLPVTQPMLFAVEYALARTLLELGVHPKWMMGHDMGEYVAACLAGVFSLKDALSLVYHRAQLMQETRPGAMLRVLLPTKEVTSMLSDGVNLAAVNGESESIVSGSMEGIASLETKLESIHVPFYRLPVIRALQSSLMDPVLEKFATAVEATPRNAPSVPLISGFTGQRVEPHDAMSTTYWVNHLRQTVRFVDAVTAALKIPHTMFLDCGPKPVLADLLQSRGSQIDAKRVVAVTSRTEYPSPDVRSMIRAIGRLWVAGAEIDWAAFYSHQRRHVVPLPAYPFQRRRYWIEPETDSSVTSSAKYSVA
jgi:acyl transferase domain-containing protein